MRRFSASSKLSGGNESGFAFGMNPSTAMANLIEHSALRILAENALPPAFSASCDHVPKYIGILAVVVT